VSDELLTKVWVREDEAVTDVYPAGRVETVSGVVHVTKHVPTADTEKAGSWPYRVTYTKWEVWGEREVSQ
jgi:hypothetical protein